MIRSMFGKSALTLLVLSSLSLAPIAATADDDDDDRNKNSFKASLQSFQEVPAVSSAAFGTPMPWSLLTQRFPSGL